MQKYDVIIIGAGAAGLMCAIESGKRHRRVLVLDHANKIGKKILMSGGGRCNFTNYTIQHDNYISHNADFCRSALKRYTQWDFIELVKRHHVAFHEKTQGQLFCDHSSKDIVNLLVNECEKYQVTIRLNTPIQGIDTIKDHHFKIVCQNEVLYCHSLVVATGGLSIPTLGATPFGYQIAAQFDIPVWPTRAGLVALTLHTEDKEKLTGLAGVSVDCEIASVRKVFCDKLLFTHRGLSGPAVLQISSYWLAGEPLIINLLPNIDLMEILQVAKTVTPHQMLKTVLAYHLPKQVVATFCAEDMINQAMKSLSNRQFNDIVCTLQQWRLKPNSTEGYRTAEVTLGGVDCDAISSKTMEAHQVPGLYFIGEVLDVTGWLGGFNFQWAWSSGWAAGQVV